MYNTFLNLKQYLKKYKKNWSIKYILDLMI